MSLFSCISFSGLVYLFLIFLGPSIASSVAGGSGSHGGARKNVKKGARQGKKPAGPVDEEVIVSSKMTRRQKSKAAIVRMSKPFNTLTKKEFIQICCVNQYATPRATDWTTPEFWSETQERIYSEVYGTHKNKYTRQFYIDVDHLR